MDTNKNSKKIIILGVILLIIAGLIVVALRGFNVSLMFGKHETIEIKIGKEVDLKMMEQISKETFQSKNFMVKELEVFGDSIQINVESITNEEKTNLIHRINETFGVSKTVEDLNIHSVANKRIRDVIKLYILPVVTSFVVVFIYFLIRFRKINAMQIIVDFIQKVVFIETILLSIIAITRLPVTDIVIFMLILIPIIELIFTTLKSEEKLELEENEQ